MTTGFTKTSMRELTIWDSRNLSAAVTRVAVGQGSGAFNPMFDEDTNVLFLNAKVRR